MNLAFDYDGDAISDSEWFEAEQEDFDRRMEDKEVIKICIPIFRDEDNSYPDEDVEFSIFGDNDEYIEIRLPDRGAVVIKTKELSKLLKLI